MLSKKVIALLCAATLSASSVAALAADPKATAVPSASPEATVEATVDPSASPEATVDPSASPEATAEATVDPSASPEATVDPSASPEATAEPEKDAAIVIVEDGVYAIFFEDTKMVVSSWFYDEFKDAEFDFALPVAEDYTKPATRLEFAQIVANYLAANGCLTIDETAVSPFADTKDAGVAALYAAKIVEGVSEEGAAEMLFDAEAPLTREATATILARAYKSVNDEEIELKDFVYDDDTEIADWAVESVYTLYALGMMQGDAGKFDPKSDLTVEQALAATVRSSITAPEATVEPSASPEATVDPSASPEATAEATVAPSASPEATAEATVEPSATLTPSGTIAPSATLTPSGTIAPLATFTPAGTILRQ